MKTAIYIENGVVQLVLTAESDFERMALGKLEDINACETYRGSFYECSGGWVRQAGGFGNERHSDSSLIFVLRKPEAGEDPPT